MSIYKTASSNIIKSDYPDLDVIRVDDVYYMVSTTMHYMPGCVILRSYNLLDWEFCSYVYNELDGTAAQKLDDNKGIYGRGMWAASLRYNKGIFYVSFVCNDTQKTYLYTSSSIHGPWKKSQIPGFYHDMSVLFDDNGKVYIVSGNTDIHLTEMNSDLSDVKKGGVNKIIIQDNRDEVILGYEGSHIYKINGKYYIFFIHMLKNNMRSEACFVADNIEGPYKGGDVLNSDLGNWNSGVAQGGIVQANDGRWYAILFQDHGVLGRIPVLVPVDFSKDLPVFGVNGKVPDKVTVLDNNPEYKYDPLYGNLFTKDDRLLPFWQFNHTPDYNLISFTENSYSITTDKTVINITQAKNTLTQRTFEENCCGSVQLDARNINEGDFTGICAFEGEYAFIGITKKDGKFYLVTSSHKSKYGQWTMNVFDDDKPEILTKTEIENPEVHLKLDFDLTKEMQQVELMYKKDNSYVSVGTPAKLRYTLDHFVGARFGLFLYSTVTAGGKASFSNFQITTGKHL